MSKILITKPNVINKAKQKELKEAGYVVIETNEPKDIQVIDEFGDLDRDTLLNTALTALDWGNDPTCRNAFGTLLRKSILKKRGVSENGS